MWLYQIVKEDKIKPKYTEEHLKRVKKIQRSCKKIEDSIEENKTFIDDLFDTNLTKKYKEYTFNGNAKYYGEMKGRKREGKGRTIWENGDSYTGLWVDDKQHGIGRNL